MEAGEGVDEAVAARGLSLVLKSEDLRDKPENLLTKLRLLDPEEQTDQTTPLIGRRRRKLRRVARESAGLESFNHCGGKHHLFLPFRRPAATLCRKERPAARI